MKTEELIMHYDDLEINYNQLEQILNEAMCQRALELSKRKAPTVQELTTLKADLEQQNTTLKATFGLNDEPTSRD